VRFLFTTLTGLGHFHPLEPVARALRAAGHDVRFATAPSFHRHVAASGFSSFAAGFDRERDGSDGRYVSLQAELEALPPDGPARTLFRIRRLFAGLYAERMIPDLLAIAEEWIPDVLVREVAEFGACVAAEVLGIPHASVRSNTMLSADSARDRVAGEMATLRSLHGLPLDPHNEMLFRFLHLAFEPPGFGDRDRPPTPTAHLLRPVPFSSSGDEPLPDWVENLSDRPVVCATLGTVFNTRTPGLFEAIIDGLRSDPIELIVTVGRDRDPAEFGGQPSNVHIVRYISQDLLLPHCDLVLTHAGFSTVAAALSLGLPIVAIPIDADQPANAERCVALGVAETIEAGRRTSESIRESTLRVLRDPSYRENAERVRDRIAALPGPDHAAALLVQLATERRPIHAT
jgi:UDP:flavonoid glycosyltransferase YjiC (YdhE family)